MFSIFVKNKVEFDTIKDFEKPPEPIPVFDYFHVVFYDSANNNF